MISKGSMKQLRFVFDLAAGTPGKGRLRAVCWQRIYTGRSEGLVPHRLSPRLLS